MSSCKWEKILQKTVDKNNKKIESLEENNEIIRMKCKEKRG